MKIKKNKTLLLILISLVILCLVPLYNHALCPFEGYNKDILFNSENYDLNYEKELRTFYDNHVYYYRYEEKYATKFYYKFGKKSLMNFITIIYFYSMESYSYIISLDDDYDDMKEKMLNGTRLISTPIGHDDYSFENNFNVNGSVYNGSTYLYERNILGDIIRIYDEEGNIVGEYAYDAYGKHIIKVDVDKVATLNPFRYRGYYYDDKTQLYILNI